MYLKRGARGPDVRRLQGALLDLGYRIAIDGAFGPATESTVRQFQNDYGLDIDGVVGTITWSALLSRGAFVVRPATRWFGARRVRLWHAVIRRDRVKARVSWSEEPIVMLNRLSAARSRGEPIPAWHRKPLTQLAHGVLLAVNGGFFDTASGWPIGPTIHAGQSINDGPAAPPNQYSVVVTQPDLARVRHSPGTVDYLLGMGVRQAFSTIPMLIRDGRIDIGGHDPGHHGPQPRTLLGWNKTEIHLVVADGRSWVSRGITMEEGAQLLLSAGCQEGVNLDSGGSTEMVLAGEVLNRPSDGAERLLPAALIVELS